MTRKVRQQFGFALVGMILRNEDLGIQAIPTASPIFVGPYQGKWDVDFPVREKRVNWLFQQPLTVKRIIIEKKAVNPRAERHFNLAAQRGVGIKRIKTQIARHSWLIMAFETRETPGGICPFREARSPPSVVLRNGMELRQVEREDLRPARNGARQHPDRFEVRPRPRKPLYLGRDRDLSGHPGM